MPIDFTMPPNALEVRDRVRAFFTDEIEPAETENNPPLRHEVSMTGYHVANLPWEILDRAIQVHGALGFSSGGKELL